MKFSTTVSSSRRKSRKVLRSRTPRCSVSTRGAMVLASNEERMLDQMVLLKITGSFVDILSSIPSHCIQIVLGVNVIAFSKRLLP